MDWTIEDKRLIKDFNFNSFIEAINFINKILPIAEKNNHHPDILIHSYNKVKIFIYTHSEENITEKDYNLAKLIDNL